MLRWANTTGATAAFLTLAVLLYLDREFDVASAIPLHNRPTPPFVAFLMFATLCFPLGLIVVTGGIADWLRALMSRSWPTVPGRVLTSEAVRTPGRGPQWMADIRYDYAVDGKRYTGSNVRFSQGKFRFLDQAQRVVERYPAGAEISVRFDPADPRTAVLEASPGAAVNAIWLGVMCLGFPFLIYFQIFRDWLNG